MATSAVLPETGGPFITKRKMAALIPFTVFALTATVLRAYRITFQDFPRSALEWLARSYGILSLHRTLPTRKSITSLSLMIDLAYFTFSATPYARFPLAFLFPFLFLFFSRDGYRGLCVEKCASLRIENGPGTICGRASFRHAVVGQF